MIGTLAVRDDLRPEAAEVVARLHADGYQVAMLTGDNERTAAALAAQAGITDVALMGEDLRHLPHTLTHARRARSIMLQNVGLSLAPIAILIPLAAPRRARAGRGRAGP